MSTWIFQANPKRFRILDSLAACDQDTWTVQQYRTEIHAGDRALFRVAGRDADIYAIGKVTTEPAEMPDAEISMQFWVHPEDGRELRHRVWIHYELKLLGNPLPKEALKADPRTADLLILKQPQGTNYPVTPEQWRVIERMLRDNQDA